MKRDHKFIHDMGNRRTQVFWLGPGKI
jgi:hypothetical protein